MLRRNILPSSFGRFSSSSSCFALPLLQQSFSFASTKVKSVVMKTKKKRGKGDKIDFAAIDIEKTVPIAEAQFENDYGSTLSKLNRARVAWKVAKKIARESCSSEHPHYVLRAMSAFKLLPYKASTKMRDLSIIRNHFRDDFSHLSPIFVEHTHVSLERDALVESADSEEVTPLPVFQVKKLIGNTKLLTPFDRATFQCFVLGCKPGDVHRQQRVFLPKRNLVLIRQQRTNTSTSFIRYVPSTKEQFERVWKNSELKTSKEKFRINLRKLIQQKLKSSTFTPGSIPEGAIKFLRDSGVPDKEITNVTGDGSVHTSLYARSSASPRRTAPRQQTRTITKLIKAIFPDGKY